MLMRRIKAEIVNLARTLFPRIALILELPPKARARYGWGRPPHPQIAALLEANRAEYQQLLLSFLKFSEQLLQIPRTATPESGTPMWENPMLPSLDAIA